MLILSDQVTVSSQYSEGIIPVNPFVPELNSRGYLKVTEISKATIYLRIIGNNLGNFGCLIK